MDPLAVAVGTALVGAMATDSWQQAKRALVALWRRVRPEAEVDTVGAEFGQARTRLLAALEGGAAPGAAPGVDSGVTSGAVSGVVAALETDWQFRLHLLLREHPDLAGELRRVLDAELTPLLPEEGGTRGGTVVMKAQASGSGRVYQAGRDQHITER
ncbi:hypothetical protein OG787_35160 [Streptomyces sp. NBC_00075]|uniref:hypothetical protein n=1 Tax=Streptomyces sp. NBC_00075 TaxID=2975641 RepID=UPI00325453C3